MWFCTVPETHIPSGSARASNGAEGEDKTLRDPSSEPPRKQTGDADAIRRVILAGGEVSRFHDPARPYLHPEEVEIALDIDRFDLTVRIELGACTSLKFGGNLRALNRDQHV
jgi:hypothetical protein